MNYLYLNGTQLDDVYIDTSLSFNKPSRAVEVIPVPGRNGDFFVDGGKYSNVLITYPAYIREDFETKWPRLINRLARLIQVNPQYLRITTTNDSTHYRLGRIIIPQTPSVIRMNQDALFDLSFDCRPERFLVTGDDPVTLTADGIISNPTLYDSKPTIRIYGHGTLTINTCVITVGNHGNQYVEVDCEKMDCHYGSTNLNQFVTFSTTDFPTLAPGTNYVSFGGSVTRAIITPRWWEL